MAQVIERFAPSPTGELHLGHVFSAFTVHHAARRAGGQFLVRMDDLDRSRVRPEYVEGILQDLRWLGLAWDGEVTHTSQNTAQHLAAIEALRARGLVYACNCSRKDIQSAAGAPQEGAEHPPPYPGTCRENGIRPGNLPQAMRLNMGRAIAALGGQDAVDRLTFHELDAGPSGEAGDILLNAAQLVDEIGDIVLHRRDDTIAYHLAIVIDDAAQGITHVTRARDLFSSTPIHRILQALLDLPVPLYRHHRIIRDQAGRRLAKRDADRALATFRAAGKTPDDLRRMIGL